MRRSGRPSRTSSPFVRNGDEPLVSQPERRKDKVQMSMDTYATSGWREPTLKAPTASFEDHGLPRAGVLTNMQPLGTRPNLKLRLKMGGVSTKSKNGLRDEVRDTPELTPAAERARSESRPPENPTSTITPPKEDSDDLEYAPKKGKRNLSRQAKPSRKSEPHPPAPSSPHPPHSQTATKTWKMPDSIAAIVRAAAEKAESQGNKILAGALHKVYQEGENDPEFASVLEAILSQTPSEIQIVEFQRRIKEAKRQIKAASSPSTSDTSFHSPPTTQTKRVGGRGAGDVSKQSQAKNSLLPSPNLDEPLSRSLVVFSKEQSQQQSRQQPRPHSQLSRSLSPEIASQSPQMMGTAQSSPARRLRSDTASSTSSLSSVNEAVLTTDVRSSAPRANGQGRPSRAGTKLNGKAKDASQGKDELEEPSSKPTTTATTATTTTTTTKRTAADAALHDEEATVKRARLTEQASERARDFPDVQESYIREELDQQNTETQLHKTPPQSRLASEASSPASAPPTGRFRLPPPPYPVDLSSGNSSPLSDDPGVASPDLPKLPSKRKRFGNRALPDMEEASLLYKHKRYPDEDERATKKKRGSARTKTSPVKARPGVTAGVARIGGSKEEESAPTAAAAAADEQGESRNDNNVLSNDFCGSCGGPGEMVCCDGCDRAYHFNCCDPPLTKDSPELDEPWFCPRCFARNNPAEDHGPSVFSLLLDSVYALDLSAYKLPNEIKCYFEGVRSGESGEYEYGRPQLAHNSKNKPVWLDSSGRYATIERGNAWRDKKGNLIHCFQCKETTMGGQPLITCDYEGCNNAYHLDCLEPMRANLPFSSERFRNQWICPIHVDEHDIPNLTHPSWIGQPPDGYETRRPRVRRPVNPKRISTVLTRGHVNDGLIEVVFDSDDEEDEFLEEPGDRRNGGPDGDEAVYRVPARGIKLDFMAKAKQERAKADFASLQAAVLARSNLVNRPFLQQKTAINLVQLAGANPDVGLSINRIQSLLLGLTAEAPDDVVDIITAAELEQSKITGSERADLKKLMEIIRRRLEVE